MLLFAEYGPQVVRIAEVLLSGQLPARPPQMLEHDLVVAQHRRLRRADVTGCDRVVDRPVNIEQNETAGAGQPPRLGLRRAPRAQADLPHEEEARSARGSSEGVKVGVGLAEACPEPSDARQGSLGIGSA